MVTRSATTLKGKALQLLALRDYSRAELQAKLLRWLRTQTVKQAAQQASQQAKQMAGGTHMHAQAREHARGQPDVDADNAGYYLPDDTDDLSEHVLSSEAEASENHASELAQQHKQIAAVLDELQAKGWLDDRRAAEALLHQRSARLGHIRLRQVLQQKGIDADISQELLHAAAQTESERAPCGKKNSARCPLRPPSAPARCVFWPAAASALLSSSASCGTHLTTTVPDSAAMALHATVSRPLPCLVATLTLYGFIDFRLA